MSIKINSNLLSDSPFSESNKDLFTSTHPSAEDLLQDIMRGTGTCYLISGYRGAGKSSFIRRIEHKIHEANKEKNKIDEKSITKQLDKDVVFVHVNFSRHQPQTFLLRKLIRGLYLQMKDLPSFEEMKTDEAKKPITDRTGVLLEELYDKTFFDVANSSTKSKKKEIVSRINVDWLAMLSFVFLLFFSLNSFCNFIPTWLIVNLTGIVASLWVGIKSAIVISKERMKSDTEQDDFMRKSLYDDEIADHHFLSILDKWKDKYKIIFVLDELDKVDDEDIDKLLKEMKPYLVSGYASFIAVAGQNLFYKYIQSKEIDDDVLSSIFSKFIHIPLFSREEFHSLFWAIALNESELSEIEKKQADSYIDYLIFESKKVPRKFISLIRQHLQWNEAGSFIEIQQTESDLAMYSKLLDIIEKIDDEEIAAEFEGGLRDYFVMQLFIKCHYIFSSNKNSDFSHSEIIR